MFIIECPAGSYGKTCQLQCGRCAGGETCNSHTGECRRFCEPGYAMPLCQGRKCSKLHKLYFAKTKLYGIKRGHR